MTPTLHKNNLLGIFCKANIFSVISMFLLFVMLVATIVIWLLSSKKQIKSTKV